MLCCNLCRLGWKGESVFISAVIKGFLIDRYVFDEWFFIIYEISERRLFRVVKIIWSSRRIKVSRRHWGPEAPSGVQGQRPVRGSRGRSSRKQNEFEVFALAEVGSPEGNAGGPQRGTGAAPRWGVQGAKPPKAKRIWGFRASWSWLPWGQC